MDAEQNPLFDGADLAKATSDPAARAEALSDALMEAGALSVSIEDADAGTAAETPQFGEPGHFPSALWDHSRVIALIDGGTSTDKLEAMLAVADREHSLILTGNGDVLEPEHGAIAIGSGGNYALAAARALMDTDKDAEHVARQALGIAADICVYTNHNMIVETLEADR